MQLHHLKRNNAHRKSRRVGRGGKRGTYSGRGIKGLGARAGGKYRPEERDILKRIPKLRGYRFRQFRPKPAVVNLAALEKRFREGETVSPASLFDRGLIRRQKGALPRVKILGSGELKKNLMFKNVDFSRSAEEKRSLKSKA